MKPGQEQASSCEKIQTCVCWTELPTISPNKRVSDVSVYVGLIPSLIAGNSEENQEGTPQSPTSSHDKQAHASVRHGRATKHCFPSILLLAHTRVLCLYENVCHALTENSYKKYTIYKSLVSLKKKLYIYLMIACGFERIFI